MGSIRGAAEVARDDARGRHFRCYPMALVGAKSLRCFVPPGIVTLRIEAGAIATPDGFQWGSGQPAAEETRDVVAGQPNAVTLRIPAPPAGDK